MTAYDFRLTLELNRPCFRYTSAVAFLSQLLRIVIIDLGLPDCHGTECIRILRQTPETAHLPILVLSASVTDADRRGAAEAGATAFLRKPILPDDLLTALREALAGRGVDNARRGQA